MNVRATALTNPLDPIKAVTHSNPYPYYAELVARKPLCRDARLGLWVASSAEAVMAVLTSELCRVRPPAEPVPSALLGSSAADIFRLLIRMNDGSGHSPFRQAVSATLNSIEVAQVSAQSSKWASVLADDLRPQADPLRLPDFAFRLPVYVVASLLGVPPDQLQEVALWTGDFVRCFAPASRPEQIGRGKVAAGQLLNNFRSLLTTQQHAQDDGLLAALAREAKLVGGEDTNVIIANGIGFLSQAYEATAGLIGNTLVALASNREVREPAMANPSLLRQVIPEVLRWDPPVQNTRRFLARNGIVAEQEMKEGDAILVVLAAANRDPSANPNPDRFDMFRKDRRVFTFGAGGHACPGEALATTIARAGIEQLLARGFDPGQLPEPAAYRASANTRIPLWAKEADE